jgi:nucleoside-diphosphate-sugar epimerase
MKSLITGGSGFFGTNLTRTLLEKGEEVVIYDIVEPIPELKNDVEYIKGDILNYEAIKKACKNIDTIYHTAALVPISKAGKRFSDINVKGTENVARASVANHVDRFIHISSSAVYDLETMPVTEYTKINPVGDYGRAKYKGEIAVRKKLSGRLNFVIIRPRTIVGLNRAGIFQILYNWIYHNKTIYIMGDGDNLFQLISANDLSEACYAASKSNKALEEVINIGNDNYNSLNTLIMDLIDYAESDSKIKHVNANLTKNVLRFLDKLKLSPFAEWHYTTIYKSFYFDTTKAKELLDWEPKDSNTDMVKNSYDWYIKNRKELEQHEGTTHRLSPKQGVLRLIR